MEILIIVVIVGLIVAGAIYNHKQAEKRRQALLALAARHGWQFSEAKDYDIEGRYAAFPCLQRGSARYAYNLLQGPVPQGQVCAFDYHFETYSTDDKGNTSTTHHYFSTLVLDTNLPLRPLLIRAETLFDKIGEFFGHDDIDFESDEFSRTFCVKAEDRRWAFDVISQSTMEFLLAAPRFTIEFAGSSIMAYREGTFEALDFEQALAVIAGIVDRLPQEVLRESKAPG